MTTPLDIDSTNAEADARDDSPLVTGTAFTEADPTETTLAFRRTGPRHLRQPRHRQKRILRSLGRFAVTEQVLSRPSVTRTPASGTRGTSTCCASASRRPCATATGNPTDHQLAQGADPDYLITHYVGGTSQQPPRKRIRQHGARSLDQAARIVPGTRLEAHAKTNETRPACGGSLDYYAENPRRSR